MKRGQDALETYTEPGWKSLTRKWGVGGLVNIGFWALIAVVYTAATALRIVMVHMSVKMMTLGGGLQIGNSNAEVEKELKGLVRGRNEVYWNSGVLTIIADGMVLGGMVGYTIWAMWLRRKTQNRSVSTSNSA